MVVPEKAGQRQNRNGEELQCGGATVKVGSGIDGEGRGWGSLSGEVVGLLKCIALGWCMDTPGDLRYSSIKVCEAP